MEVAHGRMEIWFSLATRAAIKVSVFLWYHEDIRRLTDSLHPHMMRKVLSKLECLPLSKPAQQLVANVIGPIGKHISSWIEDHEGKLDHMNLSQVLCWKSLGTIDYKKTAEKAIRSGILDINTSFHIACSNCIEDQIIKLWTIYGYDNVYTIYIDHFVFILSAERKEISFWMSYLLHCIEDWWKKASADRFEFGFEMGIDLSNEEFSRYYLNKLPELNRDDILVRALHTLLDKERRRFNTALFRLVVSELSYSEIEPVFIEYSDWLLCLLLEWPLQDFFLNISDRGVRDSITVKGFFSVLLNISKRMLNYVRNEMYEDIFETFWTTATKDNRNYVITEWIWDKFLNHVFSVCSKERHPSQSDFAAKLRVAMSMNGILVLEVLTASCFLDMLESIITKYMREDQSATHFQNAIRKLRIDHECELYCHPGRFDPHLNRMSDTDEDD